MKRYIPLFALYLLSSFCGQAKVTYVQIGATGLRNGTSWANAYSQLDSALLFESNLDTVWVANGIHRPFNITIGFHLVNKTKLFGGFDGSETSLSQRKWWNFFTVLEGTLFGSTNQVPIVVWIGRNFNYSSTLITGPLDVRLDGFKVTGANHTTSALTFPESAPIMIRPGYGPMLPAASLRGSTAVIANCLITGNTGGMGGAVAATNHTAFGTDGILGEIRIENCRFENNYASIAGGAIFTGNSDSKGSVPASTSLAPTKYRLLVTDCSFKNNSAPVGGAIALWDTTTIINRCTFSGNIATNDGGAIYDTLGARLMVYNSVFIGNMAKKGSVHYSAAASSLYKPKAFFHNTISGNVNTETVAPAYAVTLRGSTDSLINCILWDNVISSSGGAVLAPTGSRVSNNLIQGTVSGATSTYTFSPSFRTPGSSTAAPFPLSAAYDYQLLAKSWAIDTAINLGLLAPFNLDRNGTARVRGSKPDLGAYELAYCAFPMTVTPASPVAFCAPGKVTLKAGPTLPANTFQYFWNGGSANIDSIQTTSSGTFRLIGINDTGCRASASITVTAVPTPNPVITKTGNTLSVPSIYATYQWYKGSTPIASATAATYNPSSNGVYTVQVTTVLGACGGSSTPYNLINLDVDDIGEPVRFSVYPNPSNDGRFKISMDGGREASVFLINIAGQILYNEKFNATAIPSNYEIDLSYIAKGVYFMKVSIDGWKSVTRIVIN